MIYIVNKHNKPLMPTNRHSHIRKLIKQGKAVVINSNPFTVKLKYETADVTQPLYCGIDTGRENIGLGVSNEKGECVLKVKVVTSNKTIKVKMDKRRSYRQERHSYKRQKKQRKALKKGKIIQSKNEIEYKNNNVKNLIGLCKHCHDMVHKDESLLKGIKQQCKISLLNTVMPYLLDEFVSLTKQMNIEMKICTGYDTYKIRQKYNIGKEHSNDGYAISLYGREIEMVSDVPELTLRRFKKKSNNNISKLGQREYYLNDKLVAVNRHKSMCQTCDSFEEFKQKHSKTEVAKVVVKPAKRIYTYHKDNVVPGFHPGDIVKYEKHNKIRGNIKKYAFPVIGVDLTNQSLYYTTTKNRRMKYCQRIGSGALQFI